MFYFSPWWFLLNKILSFAIFYFWFQVICKKVVYTDLRVLALENFLNSSLIPFIAFTSFCLEVDPRILLTSKLKFLTPTSEIKLFVLKFFVLKSSNLDAGGFL